MGRMTERCGGIMTNGTAHANKEAIRVFFSSLTKHWRRGNWHKRPQPIISLKLALCARMICKGPPYKQPWYLPRVKL